MRQLKGQENNLPIPAWWSDCLNVAACSACHQCEGCKYTKVYSELLAHFYTKQYTDFLPDFAQISNEHLHGLNDELNMKP